MIKKVLIFGKDHNKADIRTQICRMEKDRYVVTDVQETEDGKNYVFEKAETGKEADDLMEIRERRLIEIRARREKKYDDRKREK
ncbi:MAG: hypothetical protein PHC62_00465 [Candidatus Izemoplasmatales bacterium]|nr:hypothetical protein [Candidatus Izemoplasmatales bacterium]